MSKVRVNILAVLAAIAFGLCGALSASAAPANGIALHKVAPAADLQKTWYYRRRYYRPYYSYRPYYRPYWSYRYRPYYRPYWRHYGYRRPYYYYRPYYRRYYW
jgi:hypothetical protein